MPGVFDHHYVHTQTQSKVRHTVLSSVLCRLDFALDTPIAKATGNNDSLDISKQRLGPLCLYIFRIDPDNLDKELEALGTHLPGLVESGNISELYIDD